MSRPRRSSLSAEAYARALRRRKLFRQRWQLRQRFMAQLRVKSVRELDAWWDHRFYELDRKIAETYAQKARRDVLLARWER